MSRRSKPPLPPDPATICQAVVAAADRFGPTNPQQLRQWAARLSRLPAEAVFPGLLEVCVVRPNDWVPQEFAGRLLAAVSPDHSFELPAALQRIVGRWELSIEEFPWHFARVHGRPAVVAALRLIAAGPLTEVERRSVEVFQFWLGGWGGARQP